MKKYEDSIYDRISKDDVVRAAYRAFKEHSGEHVVLEFARNMDENCTYIFESIKNHTYLNDVGYRKLTKTNNNKKIRKIDSPTLITRIHQYVALDVLEKIYYPQDNLSGLNCKVGCGITSNERQKSLIHRLKHIYYDATWLQYALVIDQRQCYAHITVSVFRREAKLYISDTKFIDYVIDVSFVNGILPIGTPISPMLHHIVMLDFDKWIKSNTGLYVRYADDNFIPFRTKEEAHQFKWRVKNYWWYRLKIRAKRHTVKIIPLSLPLDFCGYVFHRNNKMICDHNKGYTTVRQSTINRAKRCQTNESWGAYFGIMKHADTYRLMLKIQDNMKLAQLTNKIKIDRDMDAPNIKMDALLGQTFTLHKYETRTEAKSGQVNWIKCLIGVPEKINDQYTGKELAYEFHGNYKGIYTYLLACEKVYSKQDMLPIEDAEIVDVCGYIFKNSTNQLTYIS